jgi:Ca2+-binding RTX toxin-like protein
MARFVANVAFDMYQFVMNSSLMEFFEFGDITTHTSTTFVVVDSSEPGITETLRLTGSFGGYQDDFVPTTGTVTGGSYTLNGTTLFTFSDASIPVSDGGNPSFTSFVEMDDIAGLLIFLLRGNDEIIGSNGDDTLYAFAGDDMMDGRGGNDKLAGGTGNDVYVVDSANDLVFEFVGEGVDTVRTSVNYLLSGYEIENLLYTGSSDWFGRGNSLANTITGGSGNDLINGLGGNDIMIGGDGNDEYIVDQAGDVVVETATGGRDKVSTSLSYTLGANIEDLYLASISTTTGVASGPINGTGNALDNRITGNDDNNIIDGAAGADTMLGGGGDDHYIVDNANDVVTESSDSGTDMVESFVSFTLGANVENLTLAGTNSINATGNALVNSIVGNAGANVINGGAGADTMVGNYGNDTYFVDDSDDQVIETAVDGGTDTVYSIATAYALINDSQFGYVENLTYTGTGDFVGMGNALDNTIRGNVGNDTLSGLAGLDRLYGGAGNDT